MSTLSTYNVKNPDSASANLQLDSNGNVAIQAGSASAPSLYLTGDSNTGLSGPAADTLAVSTGGSERCRVDSSGRLLVGTSTSVGTDGSLLQVVGGDTARPRIHRNVNDQYEASITLSKARGTGTQAVSNNDDLGSIYFQGANGSAFNTAAVIQCSVDGTVSGGGANDMPGRLVFATTADGASSPTERLRIANNAQMTYNFASNDAFRLVNSNANPKTGVIQIYDSGAFNDFSGLRFNVNSNGNVTNTNNSYGAISDVKLKENIIDANSQWDDLKALQVRKYNFKEGQTHTQIGLIAQEVELVSPGLVTESPDRDEDGNDLGTVTKSVNYSVLYMKAVKALQEAMERIEALEAKVAALEGA